MPSDIAYEADYAHPPELLWRALTDPAVVRTWLMETTLGEARAGARFEFRDRPRPFWDGVCACEIAEATAPRQLTLRWGIDKPSTSTTVAFTITPTAAGGAHLAFRHSGLRGWMGWMMKQGMSKGWRRMVERSLPYALQSLAAGRVPERDAVKAIQRAP